MNTTYDLTEFPTICHLLIWRSELFPDIKAMACLDHKGKESDSLTYRKLSSRIANLALHLVQKKQIRPGDYVIVLQSHGIDFIVSLYACMYAGIIPIPVSPPDSGRLFEDLTILTEIAQGKLWKNLRRSQNPN